MLSAFDSSPCLLVSIRVRLWALPERLWDGGQQFLWRGRGGGRRLCHAKQPVQQPRHQHVAGGSPWRQRRDSVQWDNKAQVRSAICPHGFPNWPHSPCAFHLWLKDEQTQQRGHFSLISLLLLQILLPARRGRLVLPPLVFFFPSTLLYPPSGLSTS